MKIYRFNDLASHWRADHANPQAAAHGLPRSYTTRTTSAGDSIEISAEAKRRFEAEKVVELETARMRRDSRDYLALIRESIDLDGADLRAPRLQFRSLRIKEALEEGRYDPDAPELLRESAEKLIWLIG